MASVAFIALGFYQSWRARQCRTRSRTLSLALLWISAVIVFVSIAFPQELANLLAGGGEPPAGQPAMVTLTADNFATLPKQFNEASGSVRVILLMSPT